MKVAIIYDTKGGNTEKMARAIAEGASSVKGTEVNVMKISEKFPLSKVAEADIVVFGSPVIYADITDGLRSFLEHLKRYITDGKMSMKGKHAAIFGSYGYDGAWIMEERLKQMVKDLGYKVHEKVHVETDNEIKYNAKAMENSRTFGKEIAQVLKK